MPVVAGVDSSTQSTTVVLHDLDSGALLGTGSVPHSPTFPPVSEQDPAEWWTALTGALATAREQAGVRPDDIVGISAAAQCHGLVALDEHDAVIRPVKLWNDLTSAGQAERLRGRLGAAEWVRRVGSAPTSSFTVAKLAAFAENEPALYRRLRHLLLPHDWLIHRLSGRYVSDRSGASGTAYFNAARMEYDPGILALVDPDLDWRAVLPTVLAPGEAAGTILPAVADELGLSRRAIVGAGAGDQHAGAVGLGVVPGDVVLLLGTRGVVYSLHPTPVVDDTGVVNSVAAVAGGYQPLVGMVNCTKVTDSFARLLGVDLATLAELARAAPRADSRPVLAAYLDGERFPDRPSARGTLTGLTSATSRVELALAAHEGVVFGLERARRHLASFDIDLSGRTIAIGGGATSPAYRQLLADVTGRPIQRSATRQPVASGAAVQVAALVTGRPLADLAQAWAGAVEVVAEARTPLTDTIFERYLGVANWEGADSWQQN
ncbi:MAG: FGGY family carbohydrate kinase [Propionicimonas sp.]|nr:FGGY family carbohydrate kinase [Propionicimonas sp.]